jgi:phosphoenolpyruvate carboxylase
MKHGLATIQQYAIVKMREMEQTHAQQTNENIFGKLVMRCSFGIINAARNSV